MATLYHRGRARLHALVGFYVRVAIYLYAAAIAPTFVDGIASNQIRPGNTPDLRSAPPWTLAGYHYGTDSHTGTNTTHKSQIARQTAPKAAFATITNTNRTTHPYRYDHTSNLDWPSRDPIGERGGNTGQGRKYGSGRNY